MSLDIHTLSAVSVALLFGIALVLAALALSNKRQRVTAGSFALGYAALAAGILGLALRHRIPELLSVVLANCFIGVAVLSFWRGSRLIVGKAPRLWLETGLIGSLFLWFAFFTFVQPDVRMRVSAISTFAVLCLWLAGAELWPKAKTGWCVERLLFGLCVFGTLLFCVRVGLILRQGMAPALGDMRPLQAAIFLLVPVVNYVILAFGVLWYVLSNVNAELLAKSLALQTAKEEAERANQAKSRFLANMSHELRTPLNAIIGFSQVIKDNVMGPRNPIYAEYARDIFHAGEHLLEIINNVLDISKVEAGKTELRDELIDPAKIVDESVAAVRMQATNKKIALATNVPPGIPLIRGDTLRLRQVLINLVSNAVKFTEVGQVLVSTCFDAARGLSFAIADTGIGMSTEDIATALEPFGQIENTVSKKYAGTGLGLPLANGLVALHGGRLEIASVKGAGTTITVCLPLERVVQPTREAAA